MADVRITIPMVGFVDSYNISVAAALLMWEARRSRVERLGCAAAWLGLEGPCWALVHPGWTLARRRFMRCRVHAFLSHPCLTPRPAPPQEARRPDPRGAGDPEGGPLPAAQGAGAGGHRLPAAPRPARLAAAPQPRQLGGQEVRRAHQPAEDGLLLLGRLPVPRGAALLARADLQVRRAGGCVPGAGWPSSPALGMDSRSLSRSATGGWREAPPCRP